MNKQINIINEYKPCGNFINSFMTNIIVNCNNKYNLLITSHSHTLIDNVFSNVINPDTISGNLTATISDHLPQFAIIPNMFGNIPGNKSNIYERDWSKFDQENFILDYFSVDWEDLLKINELNADNLTKIYLGNINMLLDTYTPLTKINKYKLKFKSKPWIT